MGSLAAKTPKQSFLPISFASHRPFLCFHIINSSRLLRSVVPHLPGGGGKDTAEPSMACEALSVTVGGPPLPNVLNAVGCMSIRGREPIQRPNRYFTLFLS